MMVPTLSVELAPIHVYLAKYLLLNAHLALKTHQECLTLPRVLVNVSNISLIECQSLFKVPSAELVYITVLPVLNRVVARLVMPVIIVCLITIMSNASVRSVTLTMVRRTRLAKLVLTNAILVLTLINVWFAVLVIIGQLQVLCVHV